MPDNIKTISQRTGEFIEEDSSEPGFQINMDDEGAQAFIDKIKGVSAPGVPTSTAPIKSNPEPVRAAVAEKSVTTSQPVTKAAKPAKTTASRRH